LGKVISVLRGLRRPGIDLAMDLGTANTLIYLKEKGIVVNEPSVVAIDTRNKKTVAVRREAREFLGRAAKHILAARPLKDGVIADFDAAMAMIRGFLARVFKPRFWLHPRIVIGVPSGITKVEKRAIKDSAYEAGAREIFLLEEPMAAAMGVGLDVERPLGNMVVDIGGGTTEVAVISLYGTVYCESIRVAGDEMDEAIALYLQRQMHLEISLARAEEIKIRIGCAVPEGEDRKMDVTGRQLGDGGPRTVELTSFQMSEALEKPVDEILDTVRRALEKIPPALLADIQERGIILTGGGALLSGLAPLIARMTGMKVSLAEDPLASVVRGCGMAVEDPARWHRVLIR